MSDATKIEWSDATWNPVTGCTKVSQGCKNCYALRDWARLKANPKTVYYGREFTNVQCHPERLEQPRRWRKPRRIFVNSMSDLFHERVPYEYIASVFHEMSVAKHHTFQVLTKRPEVALFWFGLMEMQIAGVRDGRTKPSQFEMPDSAWPLPNVWLGVSVEDQATADERIPLLLKLPAAVRWISAEPLLGPVKLNGWPLDWVVAGGESGPRARPSHPGWFRSLQNQCALLDIPFLFKQWGEWAPGTASDMRDAIRNGNKFTGIQPNGALTLDPNVEAVAMRRIGKKAAGRELDGRTWDEYPG